MTDEFDHGKAAANATSLAQLIAHVLEVHGPVGAKISEDAKKERIEEFLEELEDHTADISGPLIQSLLATGKMPDEITKILSSITDPEHQVSALAGQFLVYGVGFAVAQQVLAPFLQSVGNALWETNTVVPLSASQLAIMAVRGINPLTTAITPIGQEFIDIAAQTGISAQYMQAIVDATGQPPSPQDLFQMIRRNLITEDQLTQGLKEGDTRDEWIPTFSQLRYVQPSPIDMVNAAIREQLPYDQAKSLAIMLGLEPAGYIDDNPDWFDVLFDVAGRPPGPEELGRMVLRGIIPLEGTGPTETTFYQGIAESDVKTKWTAALWALQQYVPPPRTIGTLLKSGSITEAQATTYWEMSGVPAALAAAYVHNAVTEETIQEKALAKGEILKLLEQNIISEEQAMTELQVIGYVGTTAAYIVELTLNKREWSTLNKVVNRVISLYSSFKMTAKDAQDSLNALGIPANQITDILEIADIERGPETRLPTISQLAKAVQYGSLAPADALNRAVNLGYTAYDAYIILAGESEGGMNTLQIPPDDDTGVNV